MIPKIIHYCWFGGKPLPRDAKKCVESWKKMCPDYEIMRWDESNFNVNEHPFTKAAYEAKAWAFVSDYARLKVVYDNGGIYLDTDVELLKNLDGLLENQCYIGVQQVGLLCNTGLGFGAVKSTTIVKTMLDKYTDIVFSNDTRELLACPYLNDAVIRSIGYIYKDEPIEINGTLILPPKYFDPYPPGDAKDLFCEDTISIHHYSGSWTGINNRVKRKIARVIGNKNIIKIKALIK